MLLSTEAIWQHASDVNTVDKTFKSGRLYNITSEATKTVFTVSKGIFSSGSMC